jgi:hypothetical protein
MEAWFLVMLPRPGIASFMWITVRESPKLVHHQFCFPNVLPTIEGMLIVIKHIAILERLPGNVHVNDSLVLRRWKVHNPYHYL